jgi:hypothetical protein
MKKFAQGDLLFTTTLVCRTNIQNWAWIKIIQCVNLETLGNTKSMIGPMGILFVAATRSY